MSGVAALVQLLTGDASLTAVVPATNIMGGLLPLGSPMPGIAVMSVSQVDRNIPAPGGTRHVVERVQVTIMAATYPEGKAIKALVKKAAADKMPIVDGITDVVILSLGAGPDFTDEAAKIVMQVQDFSVSYNEPT